MNDAVGPNFNTSNFIDNLTLSQTLEILRILVKNDFINSKTINTKLFGKMIRENFVKIETKLNLQNTFQIYCFLVILVSYLIVLNFLQKNSKF